MFSDPVKLACTRLIDVIVCALKNVATVDSDAPVNQTTSKSKPPCALLKTKPDTLTVPGYGVGANGTTGSAALVPRLMAIPIPGTLV
ncbi:hypothetical protein [Candidatus Erwinia dacicola]|uniref:Uncharacterized protein n=1 Tax=Candidatus Erwinia dacicola TaxID=252393 RepID=A0A328TJD6_9GAMM|nr:hypothetical protein [Candidatus Erwinia dacicola]NJD00307.1 hypothetical protein [Candidatus Erwinia dacicola]NJD85230.1 hypothetical protein [Candidatus Erwinia dacicola]RAP70727.1 hypothetical protein ACZ87_02468 [Candidatus Erwinia dacicola]